MSHGCEGSSPSLRNSFISAKAHHDSDGPFVFVPAMAMLLKTSCHHRGFPMILDTDIHNFYEHLVLKEIENRGLARH